MGGRVRRLGAEDEPALRALLDASPVVNLFLRAWLDAHPVDRGYWYGTADLGAAVMVVPGRVTVPFAPDDGAAAQLGGHLRAQHSPTLLVGPRAACDGLWAGWANGWSPRRRHDQRLYVHDGRPPEGDDPPGLRLAALADAPAVAHESGRMEREDTGVDPTRDLAGHLEAVRERIRTGRTFVIEERPGLVFQVHVGTLHPDGAQLGGTWVPPRARGRGLATAGVGAVVRRLRAIAPRVTLHVHEANAPAVRVYEKVGFRRDAPYRLIVP
jgi:RimJ/RimL family protein N-acetyltransferase